MDVSGVFWQPAADKTIREIAIAVQTLFIFLPPFSDTPIMPMQLCKNYLQNLIIL